MNRERNQRVYKKVIRKKVKLNIRKRNNSYENYSVAVIFIHAFLVPDTFPTKKHTGTSNSAGSCAAHTKMSLTQSNFEPDSSNSLWSSFAASWAVSAFLYECI